MALIKFGGGILEMRGKIGGNVYSKNRYGNYVRQGTIPVNPKSSRQQAIRNQLGQIVSAWSQLLTPAQRAAWDVYASNINFTNQLGETITLTGYNHYVRSNVARIGLNLTRVDAGPTVMTLPATDGNFSVAMSESTQLMTVTFDDAAAWCSEDSAWMSIHQGVPQNSAASFYGNHFRRLGKLDGDSGSPISSPQTIALDFPVAADQKDWAFGRIGRADGRLSEKFRDDAIVGA